MTGSWPGVNCGADWAWFNAKEDAHLLASALAARAQGNQIRLYVDAMQKFGTACHVMTIMILP
jgi:hypothetical protein